MGNPTQTGGSTVEDIPKALKAWGIVVAEVVAVGGGFLVGWAPPGNAGGISSWAVGLGGGAALVVMLALVGAWPARPSKAWRARLQIGMAALALLTIGLTTFYGLLLGEWVYTWPEPGGAAAAAPQRYVRGDVLTTLGREDLGSQGLSPSAAVDRAGGQPLVDQEGLLWTAASRLAASEWLTLWYVLTVCAWSALIVGLMLLGGKRLMANRPQKAQSGSPPG